MAGRLAVATLVSCVFLATTAWAESKPPGKGGKPDAADVDKSRVPAKGKGFYSLPEKEDEVLLRGKPRSKPDDTPGR